MPSINRRPEAFLDWRPSQHRPASEIKINACSIFTLIDGKFTDQRIYVDNAPIDPFLLRSTYTCHSSNARRLVVLLPSITRGMPRHSGLMSEFDQLSLLTDISGPSQPSVQTLTVEWVGAGGQPTRLHRPVDALRDRHSGHRDQRKSVGGAPLVTRVPLLLDTQQLDVWSTGRTEHRRC